MLGFVGLSVFVALWVLESDQVRSLANQSAVCPQAGWKTSLQAGVAQLWQEMDIYLGTGCRGLKEKMHKT